jgi:putative flippase GtrA
MAKNLPQNEQARVRTLLRSWFVGGLATIPHLLSLWLLVDFFGVDKQLANPPALIIGLTIQFFGNKYFAFEDHSPRLLHQGSLFVLVEIGAFVLNLATFALLVALFDMHWLPAMLIGTAVVYQGFSFPLWGYIFKKSVEEPAPVPPSGSEFDTAVPWKMDSVRLQPQPNGTPAAETTTSAKPDGPIDPQQNGAVIPEPETASSLPKPAPGQAQA